MGRARQRFCQFTAIDEATPFRVLRIYDHNNTKTAIDFLNEDRPHLALKGQTPAARVRELSFSNPDLQRIGVSGSYNHRKAVARALD